MSEKDNFSFTKGSTIFFRDGHDRVRLWFSTFSGLQRVFFNDRLVSSKRTFNMSAQSHFIIDHKVYSIDIVTKSLRIGPIECTLSRNAVPIQRKTIVFAVPMAREIFGSFMPSLGLFLIAAIVLALIASHFEIPSSFVYVGLFLVAILATVLSFESKKAIGDNESKPQQEFVKILEVQVDISKSDRTKSE